MAKAGKTTGLEVAVLGKVDETGRSCAPGAGETMPVVLELARVE